MTHPTEPPVLGPLDDEGRALIFTDARTARTFSGTPVSAEELTGIWELAKWAPTAGNTQPMRVLYVRSDDGRRRLLPHMSEGNREKVAAAPATAVLAMDTDFHESLPRLAPHRPRTKDRFADDAVRREAARYNTILQAGYFILAVRAAGLAAGPMQGFDGDGVDGEFFAGTPLRSVLLVNIGHPGPAAWHARQERLADDEVISWA
ncbi:malonic semialdehyde reductase [Streptomyces sp. SM14]|uniref:malonic semialdehyde reductase n=1 Tax=Streptomyces sp. SM14 TaxID=1736045 RepID=UPI000CD574A0|nr:malonic semialdehyde reductase [Streptomyces sp. SM14]